MGMLLNTLALMIFFLKSHNSGDLFARNIHTASYRAEQ